MKIRISRKDEITCLKAAISFVENGDETLDTDRRYNTGITFHERIAELAETIASEWAQLIENDENHKQIFRITQEMIDQVDNLAEIIETELIRIII